MKRKNFYSRGFTLIELIVVIGILAILSVFLLLAVNPLEQYQKAQDARRKSDLSQIQKALEAYYQDKGRYPANSTDGNYYIQTTDVITPIKQWGESWSPYMTTLPKDNGTRRYIYSASPDGQSYWLYTSLQRDRKDPQTCINTGNSINSNDSTCANVPGNGSVLCGAVSDEICNYGATSSNVSP
jgi:type II secretion system protein G